MASSVAWATIGKMAGALGACGALSSGLLGCEALLNLNGLTEPPPDDGGVGEAAGATNLVEAEAGAEAADGTAREGDGPPTPVGSADRSVDDGQDGGADAALSGADGPIPPPGGTSAADGETFTQDDAGAVVSDAPVSDAESGMDASSSTTDAEGAPDTPPDTPTMDSGPAASCLAILKAAPMSSSATYVIAPGGTSLPVYCDMDFAGGGWTLVQSTNGGSCTPATESAGTVAQGSCAYMPTATLMALAQGSTTVHVRSASGSGAPIAYVTSATAVPIQNLQMGLITNAGEPVGDSVAEEAAWTVVGDPGKATSQGRTPQSILSFTCSVAGETWPAVYHACGNGADGFVLDVVDNVSFWSWGTLPHVNIAMEVYLR
jgi:hypothetical protein